MYLNFGLKQLFMCNAVMSVTFKAVLRDEKVSPDFCDPGAVLCTS